MTELKTAAEVRECIAHKQQKGYSVFATQLGLDYISFTIRWE